MFPGAGARVDYNEAGEVLGWDYPSYDEPEYEDDDAFFADNDYCRYCGEGDSTAGEAIYGPTQEWCKSCSERDDTESEFE